MTWWIDEFADFAKVFDGDLHRVLGICKRCRHLESIKIKNKRRILCTAIPLTIECVYFLLDKTPFEQRAVPMDCPFYAEQFLMQHQNDKERIS